MIEHPAIPPTGRRRQAVGLILAAWAASLFIALVGVLVRLPDALLSAPYLSAAAVSLLGSVVMLIVVVVTLAGLVGQRAWAWSVAIVGLWLLIAVGAIEVMRQFPALFVPILAIGAAIVLAFLPARLRRPRLPVNPADRRAALVLLAALLLAELMPLAAPAVTAMTSGWSSGPRLPVGLNRASAAMSDGWIFVLGESAEQSPGWPYGASFLAVLDVGAYPRVAEPTAHWSLTAVDVGVEAGLASGADGRIYAFDRDGRLAMFEPATGDPADPNYNEARYTELPPLPGVDMRYDPALAVDGAGRLYVIGGLGSVGPDQGELRRVDVFEPHGAWATTAPMPTPRSGAAAVVARDGRLYVFGGRNTAEGSASDGAVYDPATDSWTDMAGSQHSRFHHSAVEAADGRIWLFGGFISASGAEATDVDIFDPATGSWETWPAPSDDPRPFAAAVAGPDGRIYMIGGAGGRGVEISRRVDVLTIATR